MRAVLCLVCLLIGCSGEAAGDKESGTYCFADDHMDNPDCRPYQECKTVTEGTGLECVPLEKMLNQKVTHCWNWDEDDGEGTQVACYLNMSQCEGACEGARSQKGVLAIRVKKDCYTLKP